MMVFQRVSRNKIERILFIGSKEIGLKSLEAIYNLSKKLICGIVTMDDRDDLRTKYTELTSFVKTKKVPLLVSEKNIDLEKFVTKNAPDFCVVAGWYRKISDSVLEKIKYGTVGMHTSLLPKYRGCSPLVWAFINGEKKAGISLFYFNSGIDSGNIIGQKSFSIGPKDYVMDALVKAEEKGLAILEKNLPIIVKKGIVASKKQNGRLATYCAQRMPHDGFIDWQKPSQKIYDFIRGQSFPYPGAFSFFNGKKIIIWRVSLVGKIYFGTPGQVVIIGDDVLVICGDNKPIKLEVVEMGKQFSQVKKILNSNHIRLGEGEKK